MCVLKCEVNGMFGYRSCDGISHLNTCLRRLRRRIRERRGRNVTQPLHALFKGQRRLEFAAIRIGLFVLHVVVIRHVFDHHLGDLRAARESGRRL